MKIENPNNYNILVGYAYCTASMETVFFFDNFNGHSFDVVLNKKQVMKFVKQHGFIHITDYLAVLDEGLATYMFMFAFHPDYIIATAETYHDFVNNRCEIYNSNRIIQYPILANVN